MKKNDVFILIFFDILVALNSLKAKNSVMLAWNKDIFVKKVGIFFKTLD